MTDAKDDWKNVFAVALSLCLVCSVLVSATAVLLAPRQAENVTFDAQKNLLQAAGLFRPGDSPGRISELMQGVAARVVNLSDGSYVDDIDPATFDQRAAARADSTSMVLSPQMDLARIQRRSLYATVYLIREGGKLQQVILPVRGAGLYSTLYGFIALGSDLRTVIGLKFYEQGETAGLGAEVDNPRWLAQWEGKVALDRAGRPVLQVVKGGVRPGDPDAIHKVDAISGATITSKSVQNLLRFWLDEAGFGPYLERLRRQSSEES